MLSQMGSITSEDECDRQSLERFSSYSLSADVSESDSSSSFSCMRFDAEGASTSMASTPRCPFAGNLRFPASVMIPVIRGKDVVVWGNKPEKREVDLSEIEMMKERFSKLLLGEDMSGGGKGVCSALAISNAITNLSATVFGELWRLEPLAPQKKAMWRREMEWLLCVSDSIVELVPSVQQSPCGGTYEVMTTRPRSDLYVNLPALKKLDAMLISILDGFKETEFWYVDRGMDSGDEDDCNEYTLSAKTRPAVRQEEKWWLPYPKLPSKGLSDDARKKLQQCRDCTNQILKAALAINNNLLAEMGIPSAYLDSLPKNGKDCLGDIIYRYITAEKFSPECLLDMLDLSSEHHTLEIANRIEAAIYVWKQKDHKKHTAHSKSRHSSWGEKVKGFVADAEKNHFLAQRAEALLQSLKLRFPALPQTALDMSKIQYNKDVGQSILESYSRVMESLAFNIIARIDDVLYADDVTKQSISVDSLSLFSNRKEGYGSRPIQKRISPSPFSVKHTPYASPYATPSFCSSTPISGSPQSSPSNLKEAPEAKSEKLISTDSEKGLYTKSISAARVTGDAPERD